MSRWLPARGYPTFTCGIASHAGCTTAMVELIERRLVQVATTRTRAHRRAQPRRHP
jgi:hypothetical protein